MAGAVVIGITALVALSLVKGFWGLAEPAATVVQDRTLVEKVTALQEELKQKDVALSIQEKRLKELQEQPTLAVAQQTPPLEDPSSLTEAEPLRKSDGPLVALQESEKNDFSAPATARKPEPLQSEIETEPGPQLSRSESAEAKGPIINFNAQRVTAVAQRSNKGTLSFKLIKDQPDIRFSGYLFVFVEMGDGQDNRIYAYPKRAQLGDGDLPSDYREGESVSFKYNSRVELPYVDSRSDASLIRVSILLYGQDGKIVFQRGFDRREVKTLNARSSGPSENAKQKGPEKRRAL